MEARLSGSVRGGGSRLRTRKQGNKRKTGGSLRAVQQEARISKWKTKEVCAAHPPYVERNTKGLEAFYGACLRDAPSLENEADGSPRVVCRERRSRDLTRG